VTVRPTSTADPAAVWAAARRELDGLPGGRGLNMAHEAVDRHAASAARAGRVAIRWLARDGGVADTTYADLRARTNRLANVLDALGVRAGDRVFTLLGRVPALYVTVLGALKHRNVVCALFAQFGPEPIRQRLRLGEARVLVTTGALYRRKVAPIRDLLPRLEHVLVVGRDAPDGTRSLDELLADAADDYVIPPTDPEDLALLHFTSGTTGTPKGALHVHEAIVAHHHTGSAALDLRDGDVYWCTADPGWVTGISYGILTPLSHGVTVIADEADFDAERWYRTLQDQRVTVWYTSPTALRMLRRAGTELARDHDLSRLRFVASVGEPLDPGVIDWAQEALGLPVHDTWWQTETGAIMIASPVGSDLRPGSMGRPIPGVEVALLARGTDGRAAVRDGRVVVLDEPGVDGELALRAGWPSMFRGYLHDDARYAACFADGWYLTGDIARRDAEGWWWFLGRGDEVIKSAGHLIGPCEVERVLQAHPAVLEAGVIGVPDPVAGEIVKAFVTVRPGVAADEALRLELLGYARSRLGPAMAPRAIELTDHLPTTRSGKILRRVLRARELGLPAGDLSTLEPTP